MYHLIQHTIHTKCSNRSLWVWTAYKEVQHTLRYARVS